MQANRLRRTTRHARLRLALRTLLYWAVTAVPVLATVTALDRAERMAAAASGAAEGAAQAVLVGRPVTSDLDAATPLRGARDQRSAMLALPLLLAGGLGAFVLARTAEARRRAEARARKQLALFQLVSDNVPSPIYLKDASGRYLGCNLAFERLVGRPRDAIVGSGMDALLAPLDAALHRHADEEVLRTGGALQYEARVLNLPDGPRDLLVAKAAVHDEDETITGVTATLVDITEMRAAERELRRSLGALRQAKEEAEAGTRAKSQFLAVMSHEMRTPLNVVLGTVGLLLDGPLSRDQHEQAEMARTAGRALLELVDDLLDFSRLEAGRLDLERIAFDPARLVRDTVALLAGSAREKALALACDVAPDVPRRVAGDPGRLRQVLLNLLSNAVKFTETGEVGVALELAGRDGEGVVLRLRVRDTGPGIAPELLGSIFEPFTQGEDATRRRHGGTGLGLAIARRLTDLMGGTIEVASARGQGSAFTCTVRLGEPADGRYEEQDAGEPPRTSAVPPPARRVLLAEDNLMNQRVTRAQLERLGCVVDVAGDGHEAVRAAGQRCYDLVLMDCQMPGMDGYDATREIRRQQGPGRHVPVVALTANALRGDRERCLLAGMDDYLAKPVDTRSLTRVLERHVPSQQPHLPSTAEPPRARSADPGTGELRPVDPAALAPLIELEKTDPGFLSVLVRDFDEGFRERLVDMQESLRDNDPAGLRSAAHSLKGSAGIVGAVGMADLCLRLEGLAKGGSIGRAGDLINRLAREHEAVMPVLREAATPS
jgi:PAS domain S-box-containing protein